MKLSFLTRRKLLVALAAAGVSVLPSIPGWGANAPAPTTFDVSQVGPFMPIITKLNAGQSVVICFNADSTGFWDGTTNYPPSYVYAVYLAQKYPTHSVLFPQWAEWVVSAPTGPKSYGAATQLSTGSTGATITFYNLALPGDVPCTMLDSSRYANAIQNISPIDLMIWYEGKNLTGAGITDPVISGAFYGAIGYVGYNYPSMPQVLFAQYPNYNSDVMAQINTDVWANRYGNNGIGFVDGYNPIIAMGKPLSLYRDASIHFGPSGNLIEGNILIGAHQAAIQFAPTWSPQLPWTSLTGKNVLLNPTFAGLSGGAVPSWPVGFGSLTLSYDSVNTFGGSAQSLAMLAPDGNSYLSQFFNTAQKAAVVGKRMTMVGAVWAPPSLPVGQVPLITFLVYDQNNVPQINIATTSLARYLGNWVLTVFADMQFPSAIGAGGASIRIFPAFAVGSPVQTPCNIQYLGLVEGSVPRGLFSS